MLATTTESTHFTHHGLPMTSPSMGKEIKLLHIALKSDTGLMKLVAFAHGIYCNLLLEMRGPRKRILLFLLLKRPLCDTRH